MTPKADWDGVNITLGRDVGVSIKVDGHGLYSSVSSITDSGVPAYLKFLVNGADAETAYAGFLEFKVVVKKYQVASTDIKLWPFKVHEP